MQTIRKKIMPNQTSQKQLQKQAHHLKPVVIIGQAGLNEAVHKAIDEALEAHELVKIKIPAMDANHKKLCAEACCNKHQATLIQAIGRTVTLYRKKNH